MSSATRAVTATLRVRPFEPRRSDRPHPSIRGTVHCPCLGPPATGDRPLTAYGRRSRRSHSARKASPCPPPAHVSSALFRWRCDAHRQPRLAVLVTRGCRQPNSHQWAVTASEQSCCLRPVGRSLYIRKPDQHTGLEGGRDGNYNGRCSGGVGSNF